MNPSRVAETVVRIVAIVIGIIGVLLIGLVGIDVSYRQSVVVAGIVLLLGAGALALGVWLWRVANALMSRAGATTETAAAEEDQ